MNKFLIYFLGPLRKARAVMRAIMQRVKQRTNLAGTATSMPSMKKAKIPKKAAAPKAMAAYK